MPRAVEVNKLQNVNTETGNKAAFRTIASTDPAANTECSITVPANTWYKVCSASVSCVQGITQTPLPALQFADSSGNVYFSGNAASAVISVSTTSRLNWAPGLVLTAGAAATQNNAPIPDDIVAGPGDVISTVTAGIGANTNYGKLVLRVIQLTP